MTRNNSNIKTKSKFVLSFLLVAMLCLSLLFSVACASSTAPEEEKDKNTTFSYVEEDTELISNAKFNVGVGNTALKDYPKTSVTGWGKSAEAEMTASSAKSGIIDVSDAGWEELVKNLYSDSYFLNYYKVMYDFEDEDVKDAIREEKDDQSYSPTAAEVKEYVIKNYIDNSETDGADLAFKYYNNRSNQFKNPGKSPDATDDKIYMLNNYLAKSSVGLGTGQSILSTTNITLNKGEYGMVSVWVCTQNAYSAYRNGTNCGANVRLVSTINNEQVPEFGIFNITDTEWTKYTIYIKADDVYESNFSLALGLGYDSLSATEGTAYFDNVEFKHITKAEYDAAALSFDSTTSRTIDYLSEEKATKIFANDLVDGNNVKPVLYDMTFNTTAGTFLSDLSVTVSGDFTQSNKNVSGDKFGGTATFNNNLAITETFPYANKAVEVSLNKASYTLAFGSKTNAINVSANSYAYVEMFVKNELSEFGSTSVTLDVFDVFGSVVKKRAAIATCSTASEEWQKLSFVINNNFNYDRKFFYDVVIGPADVAATDYAADFATGSVTITYPKFATGLIDEFDEFGNVIDENYKFFSFYKNSATGTTALYAGSNSDFAEESEKTYPFEVAYSDIGAIESKPANVRNWQGIVANHLYVRDDDSDLATAINTSNTAGVINTDYLTQYTMLPGVQSKLNYTGSDAIQPIVIYNATETSYGFIGTSQSVAKSAYASATITLRVVDDAVATVYLVDTSDAKKSVMTFDSFTKNVDSNGVAISNGSEVDGSALKLQFQVTSDMMDSDGWTTLSFYIATGADAKDLRLEIWNGSRDNSVKSSGYVFVKSANITTASAFTEPEVWADAFTVEGNPLYEAGLSSFVASDLLLYRRELSDVEKQFNAEQKDASTTVSYQPKYVWAKNDSMIYAVYNTVDPVNVDPYGDEVEDEEVEAGCTAESDPATFWLSFSSVILGVVLVAAIVLLVIKNVIKRRKANASDAVSHYTVTSRIRKKPVAEKLDKEEKSEEKTEEIEEVAEEIEEDDQAQDENSEDDSEKSLDEYVYGEVQDFGKDDEKTEN